MSEAIFGFSLIPKVSDRRAVMPHVKNHVNILLPRKAGGPQDSPQATTTRFMIKKGAQQMMKAEKNRLLRRG